jgi:hypothetical protein
MAENSCEKCGYISKENQKKFGLSLCSVCISFAPNTPEELDNYLLEKIDGILLNTFRKNALFAGERQKKGMIQKAEKGNIMSRAPYGYKIENNSLIPAENYRQVEIIFEDFLNSSLSLNQLSKKYSFSVNGLKKILFNFTYLGKIKFNGQVHEGNHKPLVSSTLFNHVQNKLEKLKIKNPNKILQ